MRFFAASHSSAATSCSSDKVNPTDFSSFDVVFFVDPVPFSFGGKLALRKSPDQKEISHKVPLNVKLRQGKRSTATGSKEKAEAGASKLPFGLLAKSSFQGVCFKAR